MEILTEYEAAKELRLTVAQLRRIRGLGEIRFKKSGRTVTYKREWLNDYMEASCQNAENQGSTSTKTDAAHSGTSNITVSNASEQSIYLRGAELARKMTRQNYALPGSS